MVKKRQRIKNRVKETISDLSKYGITKDSSLSEMGISVKELSSYTRSQALNKLYTIIIQQIDTQVNDYTPSRKMQMLKPRVFPKLPKNVTYKRYDELSMPVVPDLRRISTLEIPKSLTETVKMFNSEVDDDLIIENIELYTDFLRYVATRKDIHVSEGLGDAKPFQMKGLYAIAERGGRFEEFVNDIFLKHIKENKSNDRKSEDMKSDYSEQLLTECLEEELEEYKKGNLHGSVKTVTNDGSSAQKPSNTVVTTTKSRYYANKNQRS